MNKADMNKADMNKEINKLKEDLVSLEKSQRNSGSDYAYWGYVGAIEETEKKIGELTIELRYLDLKDALVDFLGEDDVVKNKFKEEMFIILDEHKKLKYE